MNMALLSSSPLKFNLLRYNYNNNPNYIMEKPNKIFTLQTSNFDPRRSRLTCSVHAALPQRFPQIVVRKSGDERFASIFSSYSPRNRQIPSAGGNPNPTVQSPSSRIGSSLFWIGLGDRLWGFFVGKMEIFRKNKIVTLYTRVTSRLKKFILQLLHLFCFAMALVVCFYVLKVAFVPFKFAFVLLWKAQLQLYMAKFQLSKAHLQLEMAKLLFSVASAFILIVLIGTVAMLQQLGIIQFEVQHEFKRE